MQDEMRRAIACKRDGGSLSEAQWRAIVRGVLAGSIADAQTSALLMACVVRGLADDETLALTAAFIESGEMLSGGEATIDKHSTGGVADTASLIVVPLVAACGIPVAKLSGRALAHTGGTLDKLEAIPGVRTDLSPERFFAVVRETGCAIAAQSERLVPADKRFYALRDLTATVPSRGLIAASIVSKKIAGGAGAIVYDVKAGRGAFSPDVASAEALACELVRLTAHFGRRGRALVTDMDEPLGRAIGTGLEAIEARDFLRGERRDARLAAVVRALGVAMLEVAGFAGDPAAALDAALASGAAAARFEAMLGAQGAAPGALGALAPHPQRSVVCAETAGYLRGIDAVVLGETARDLVRRAGAAAGIVVAVRTGDAVSAGDELAIVYGDDRDADAIRSAFEIGPERTEPRPLVYRTIVTDASSTAERSTLESR